MISLSYQFIFNERDIGCRTEPALLVLTYKRSIQYTIKYFDQSKIILYTIAFSLMWSKNMKGNTVLPDFPERSLKKIINVILFYFILLHITCIQPQIKYVCIYIQKQANFTCWKFSCFVAFIPFFPFKMVIFLH